MLKWITLILGIALATPSFAEETGELTAVLDSEDVTLVLLASQSDHRGSSSFGSVSMVFSADGAAGINLIFVGFEFRDGAAAVPDIRLVAQDRSMYFPRKDDSFILEVDEATKTGEFLTVKGRMHFIADFSKDFGRTLDPSMSHEIDGTFEVVVGPV